MRQCKSRIGPYVRNGAALTSIMVYVATSRGAKRSASRPSGRGATGSAGAATRATSTGRSVSMPYGTHFRCQNPGSCTTSSGARDSKVMRQTGCRLCGEPLAIACGSRGTGCGKPSRPDLWGGRRGTGAFTRKPTPNSVRSSVAPLLGAAHRQRSAPEGAGKEAILMAVKSGK